MLAPLEDAPPTAPPVVAVMVTSVAGEWLEEALTSLAGQDYPNLSVLIIDASGDVDPTPRVAAVLPAAYIRRMDHATGFGSAANEVLSLVEGAAYFLFCHDDVALDPDVIRLLVEEAFRSNAGVVAPKLVAWAEPDRLLQVGMSADKVGGVRPLVEPGELDQQQHDSVRDIFVAPSACVLVRADLFATLGGFDSAISLIGEDLDLSWRAQIAGARVIVAPAARVRHLEGLTGGLRTRVLDGPSPDNDEIDRLRSRHRLRAMLKNYGVVHLLRVLPQAVAFSFARTVLAVITGHPRRARAAAGAWTWNLRRLGGLRAARKGVRRIRAVPDAEVRRLQMHGTLITDVFRSAVDRGWRDRSGAPQGVDVDALREGGLKPWRLPIAVWGAVVLVLAVGTRRLVSAPLPGVGQLGVFPHSPATLLRLYGSGWRPDGLGSATPAPVAFGLLGLAGTLLVGAMGLLQKLLVLGALPAGIVGAYRLTRPYGSRGARLAGVAVYALVPVPYNALALGHWSGLLTYAAAPWLLAGLAAATDTVPYRRAGDTFGRQVVSMALLIAVLGAFVPAALVLAIVLAVAVLAGSLLAGGWLGGLRAVGVAVSASALAAVLLAPWSLDLLRSPGQGLFGVAGAPAAGLGLGAVLQFKSGPVGAGVLGWAFLVAAALSLVIGRSWRLAWAVRAWSVALACWGLVWAGGRGWMPAPNPEVLLTAAAAALAMAAALGVCAFEDDLPAYRFGWRQGASVVALVAAVLGALPTAAAAASGRWYAPRQDMAGALSWMSDHRAEGAFRVLWVGDPDALPLAGWRLQAGTAYAMSEGGVPDVRNLWPPSRPGAAHMVVEDLRLTRAGNVTRLGRLLAPLGVRYLVLPLRAAPGASRGRLVPPPADLIDALATQVDLRSIQADASLIVYENTAWGPGRELLPAQAVPASLQAGPRAAVVANLSGATPVLGAQHGPASFTGALPSAGEVYLAAAAAPGWKLTVGRHPAHRRRAFGWAMAFTAVAAGRASLFYRTPWTRPLALAGQLLLWLAAIGWMIRRRGKRGPEHGRPQHRGAAYLRSAHRQGRS